VNVVLLVRTIDSQLLVWNGQGVIDGLKVRL
jgi:hypothetical protein